MISTYQKIGKKGEFTMTSTVTLKNLIRKDLISLDKTNAYRIIDLDDSYVRYIYCNTISSGIAIEEIGEFLNKLDKLDELPKDKVFELSFKRFHKIYHLNNMECMDLINLPSGSDVILFPYKDSTSESLSEVPLTSVECTRSWINVRNDGVLKTVRIRDVRFIRYRINGR